MFERITEALARLGRGHVLEGITVANITDIISVVSPVERLANTKRAKKMFSACHDLKVKELTTQMSDDSPLKRELQNHISEELSILPLMVLTQKLKSVVRYIKSSGLNEQLEGGTLKQEVDTRWMSLLHMIKSFFPPDKSPLPLHGKIDQVGLDALRRAPAHRTYQVACRRRISQF